MTTTDLLAPFQWLSVSENESGGPLGVIFSVAFFRGLGPAEVVRRFSCGDDSGQEAGFGGLGAFTRFRHRSRARRGRVPRNGDARPLP